MSEIWWVYVRRAIRDQPRKDKLLRELMQTAGPGGERPTERAALQTLTGRERREYDAVNRAVAETKRLPDGRWRVRLIRCMYLGGRRYTLPGAAVQCHVSERTAQRWHSEFVRLAASHMGLMD